MCVCVCTLYNKHILYTGIINTRVLHTYIYVCTATIIETDDKIIILLCGGVVRDNVRVIRTAKKLKLILSYMSDPGKLFLIRLLR